MYVRPWILSPTQLVMIQYYWLEGAKRWAEPGFKYFEKQDGRQNAHTGFRSVLHPSKETRVVMKQAGAPWKKPGALTGRGGREEKEGGGVIGSPLSSTVSIYPSFPPLSSEHRQISWMSAYRTQTFHPSAVPIATKPSQQLCYCWTPARGDCSQGRVGWEERGPILLRDQLYNTKWARCCWWGFFTHSAIVIWLRSRIPLPLAWYCLTLWRGTF